MTISQDISGSILKFSFFHTKKQSRFLSGFC